ETSGVCHFAYDDEETCLAEVRYLLSMLPQNNREHPPVVASDDPPDRRTPDLLDLVPVDANRPYDMHRVLTALVDDGEVMEVHEHWARNVVCALARLDGRVVGLVYAWPTNEIAVMGAEGAANVIFRRQIAGAEDPEAVRARLVDAYRAELMHPYHAAERGLVDDVVDPAETREVLARSLAMLRAKHADLPFRKHGNPPQ
uniref:carboxyl transferase domain-containing protein n=1 Tax=Streptomyces sp. NRRL F-5065 TaxID=1463855 RepID=UPI0004C0629D